MDQIRLAQLLIDKFSETTWATEQESLHLSAGSLSDFALAVQVQRYSGLLNVKTLKGYFLIHYSNITKCLTRAKNSLNVGKNLLIHRIALKYALQ